MERRLSSYQPQFFPRLHYFARILNSDIFAIADYVQFVRKHAYCRPDQKRERGPSFQAHTPIKTKDGVLLLDFPTKHGGLQSIHTTRLGYTSEREQLKNLRLITQHYKNAPRYQELIGSLKDFFETEFETVAEMNTASIYWGLAHLFELPERNQKPVFEDIQKSLPYTPFRLTQIVLFSESGIEPPHKEKGRDANDWLIETCKVFDAKEYHFGGTSADAYMDFKKFDDAGITLIKQEWTCVPYTQSQVPFLPNLSIIDLLMNVTPAEARVILHTQNQ
ncbi:hypothetical protein C4585_02260 [Candidatus Parcubacteria bacterium]|nr:MAG: hypothetical protein C4585_02260 [Candidatus Parcubacteria bacterium]